jgi:RHS repeat-associated protein
VEQRATDGGTLQQRVEYAYDAQDRRLSRVVKDGSLTVTETQRFGYDGQNVWADLDGSNALVTRRLFGPGTDNVVARITASGGAAAWYLTDRQGSVTKVANGSGSVIDTLAYDGFGNVTSESNTANGDRYKYTGREWDDVTKLQYNRARYYDAATGSWVGMDPTGFIAGDTNLYRYVGNSGPNRTDPSGLRAIPIQQFFLPYGQGAWVNEKCAQLKRELEKIQAQLAEKRKEEAALTAAQRINSPIPGEVRALERRETELSRYDRLCNKQFTMFCQDPIKEMQINFPPISLDRLQAWLELYLFLGQTYGFPAPPKPA